MTAIDIGARRAELASKLDGLRAARGRAALDGKPFDVKSILNLEGELLALDDAEGELRRRESESAAKADAERKATARARIGELDSVRQVALGMAEKAAHVLAAEIARYSDACGEITVLATAAGAAAPLALARSETDRHLSRLVAAVLVKSGWQWGVIERNSLPDMPADWAETDRAAVGKHIDALKESA